MVAISIMMLGMAGWAVHANGKSGPRVSGVLGLGSDWKCHPNHARGQSACFNTADGRHSIVTTGLK
jgi:hypothetical protein